MGEQFFRSKSVTKRFGPIFVFGREVGMYSSNFVFHMKTAQKLFGLLTILQCNIAVFEWFFWRDRSIYQNVFLGIFVFFSSLILHWMGGEKSIWSILDEILNAVTGFIFMPILFGFMYFMMYITLSAMVEIGGGGVKTGTIGDEFAKMAVFLLDIFPIVILVGPLIFYAFYALMVCSCTIFERIFVRIDSIES